MPFLERTFLGNPVESWAIALGAAVLAYFALRFVVVVVVRRLAHLAEKTRSEWDDLIIGSLQQTKGPLLLIVAVFAGTQFVTLDPDLMTVLRSATVIALLVQAGIWIGAGVKGWVDIQREVRLEDDAAAAMMMNVIGIAARIAVWSMVLMLALDNIGMDVTALVTGLGVGGIAVALAAQNILGDLFAALSIAFDKPFVPGDTLNVDELIGTVEGIGLKTTRVRSLSGEQLVFANTDLLNSRIRNYGRMYERRIVFSVGVTYQTSRELLQRIPEIIREAIEEHGVRVRFDRSHLKTFGDFAIVFETAYFVLEPAYAAYMEIQQAVNLHLHERFEVAGIEFAYPTQTLYLAKEGA